MELLEKYIWGLYNLMDMSTSELQDKYLPVLPSVEAVEKIQQLKSSALTEESDMEDTDEDTAESQVPSSADGFETNELDLIENIPDVDIE